MRWLRTHPRAAIWGGGGALLVAVVALLAIHSGHQPMPGAPEAAKPLADGTPRTVSALATQADADLAAGSALDAVSGYERALAADPTLATSAQVRDGLSKIAAGKDAVAAVIALDLLARSISPPARDVIAAQAAKHPSREVRQRAYAIAVRDGFADAVHRKP